MFHVTIKNKQTDEVSEHDTNCLIGALNVDENTTAQIIATNCNGAVLLHTITAVLEAIVKATEDDLLLRAFIYLKAQEILTLPEEEAEDCED